MSPAANEAHDALRPPPGGYDDLDEIRDFIGADSQDRADRVIRRIFARIDVATTMPHQGHRRPDLTSRPLRFLRVYDYLIAYAPDPIPLWVVAVIHGHRDPRLIAALLHDRE